MHADEHARRTLADLCSAAGLSMPEVALGGPDDPAVRVVREPRTGVALVIGPRLLDASDAWREAVLARAVADLSSHRTASNGPESRAVPYRDFVKA